MPASRTPPDAERFIPGRVLADRYRVVERVGAGGMGEVYRAIDLKLGQPAFGHPARESTRLDALGIVELELLHVHPELGEVGVVQARNVRVVVGRERPNFEFHACLGLHDLSTSLQTPGLAGVTFGGAKDE